MYEGGCEESHPIFIRENGDELQLTLCRVSILLIGGKREICMVKRDSFFVCIFWETKEELRVGKRKKNGMLEGIHCLVVYYGRNESLSPVKL
jgi:hypothetical protein